MIDMVAEIRSACVCVDVWLFFPFKTKMERKMKTKPYKKKKETKLKKMEKNL